MIMPNNVSTEHLETLAAITGGTVDEKLHRVVWPFEVYPEDADAYVPVSRWGKDHWTTFHYLETVAVDNKGVIQNAKMRTNARLHRGFIAVVSNGTPLTLSESGKHPTILADGTLDDHDDWSCLEDMIAAGLIEAEWWEKKQGEVFGHCRARVKLTALGWSVAHQLRAYRAIFHTTKGFVPNLEEPDAR